ncbi:unnamed protein product [Rhizophagus irregularis]|uniref:Uncharacterized protein n=1 Tax=Rhizophagus irregularis TaxID=588596 RepID=A0A2N1N421_9GLOM|nr:hypothetical protein RhiirC2_534011 [Rhizophagus irregularis]CAB4374976.1 unnamed protein product [Rhizophagus irregularis]CAB5368887.1 unnamed protein product [Rhizophagus irregularis]
MAAIPMIQHSNIRMNECKFFHYAPHDDKFYHIICQIILQGSVFLDDRNYDHGFFYNHINSTENYYVTCKVLPHSWIINTLNKKIYGIDIDINNLERKEFLSLNQKLDLEQDLKQILPSLLTQNHIPNKEIRMNSQNLNSSYDDNTQITSITDGQNNFGNGFSQQTRVGYFTYNVINPQQVFNNIPQQIPERLHYNGNTTSFCGNIGNNVMTTQVVSIADNQNNGFLQPTNPFSSSTSAAPQNRVAYHVTSSQRQIDFNNNPREMGLNYYGNRNSFHDNTVNNNTLATQSVLTTDINQNYGNDSQNINRERNFVCTRQQVDLNNNYRDKDSHNGNIGNNITTTQANGMTCDHQDINDIHQVTQLQQQVDLNNNYGNTDSHNGNIGNNVITTQANSMICDHKNISDIHQVAQIQQVDLNNNTDSHNGNIGNNVMTTQANDLICDHDQQDINDIRQVIQLQQQVDSSHVQPQQ